MMGKAKVVEVLRQVEWVKAGGTAGEFCPCCDYLKAAGHHDDCKLAALLAERGADMSGVSELLGAWDRSGRVMLIYNPGEASPWRLGWRDVWRGETYAFDFILSGPPGTDEEEIAELMVLLGYSHDQTIAKLEGRKEDDVAGQQGSPGSTAG